MTSGPGRVPASDGRARHRRPPADRTRRRRVSADTLRSRAEALFTERTGLREELGHGPPVVGGGGAERGTVAGTGVAALPLSHGGLGFGQMSPAGHVDDTEAQPSLRAEGGIGGGWRERAGLAVRERLPLWLQSRCGLERRSVVALAVVLVVAAGFAVQHFWSGRAQTVRPPEVVHAAAPYERGDTTPGASAAPESSPSGGPPIVVDVSGKVRSPGLRRLPPGARVADALRAAGGVRPGTDLKGLNRARFLVDGELVVVGATPAPVGLAPPGPSGAAGGPVSLNTATLEQLDALPGVGPVLAQHIVDYRTRNGGFRTVQQLREVNGIGDRRFADLRDLVRP